MSYPQTVNADYSAQGGGGGAEGGITQEEFDTYKAELNALVAAAQEVNDATTGTATTWSSTKIAAELAAI
jgi:hypothetical protein